METDDGGAVAFEVTAAARVSKGDFAGLRKLREILEESFIAGVALYTGTRSYVYETRCT